MYSHAIASRWPASFLALVRFLPGRIEAQKQLPRTLPVQLQQNLSEGRNGGGSVTLEHCDAIVIQRPSPVKPVRRRLATQLFGRRVQTGADGRIGIKLHDGTSFNLSSNAR